jgi:hypothetical protein
MSTNGSPKRKHFDDIFSESFPGEESHYQPLSSGYVGFEMVVGALISAASEAGLRLFEAASTLDTTTLERRFSASCVPQDWHHPVDLWAEMRFYWPAEYTALSLYGDEVICDMYHAENVPCRHQKEPASLFTELEVEYLLPFEFVRRLDSDEGVERTARRIRQLFTDIVEHDNIVGVEAKALFTGDELQLSSIKAGHVWVLDEELSDHMLLRGAFLEICQEMRTVLLRFNQDFAPKPESERDGS